MQEFKPQLACDFEQDKLKFPLIAMPKIDGVRALNIDGKLVGRSKKAFGNPFITRLFSDERYLGFDGELATGSPTDTDLCRKTSGNVARKKASEDYGVVWWIFDFIQESMLDRPYKDRLVYADTLVAALNAEGNNRVQMVPHVVVYNVEDLLELEEQWLAEGYEGVIMRDPESVHKHGRASTRTGSYLRIKRFVDFEGEVVGLIEAMENQNEAKTNELGLTERSSHKENKSPKGMVGMLQYRLLEDVVYNGQVLMKKGDVVDVGPGKMTHEDREHYWRYPEFIKGKIGKAKFFPKGHKDKLRFPTFVTFRPLEDM